MNKNLHNYVKEFETSINLAGTFRSPAGRVFIEALEQLKIKNISQAQKFINKIEKKFKEQAAVSCFLGLLAFARNQKITALSFFKKTLTAPDVSYEIICLVGDLLLDKGEPKKAIDAFDKAIGFASFRALAYFRKGKALSFFRDVSGAIDNFKKATLLEPNLTDAHIALGEEYLGANLTNAASESFEIALELEPQNKVAKKGQTNVLTQILPQWHTMMLNDEYRNSTIELAIKEAIFPGCSVLDIGTGTGLLAMMAARAGARKVTACETVRPLAQIAESIIAQNGLKEKITVLQTNSRNLTIGRELPSRVDLILAEIVDTGLLGENILATMNDACGRLLKKEGKIIPQGATVYAFPIESLEISQERQVNMAAGFNISQFNQLIPKIYLQTRLNNYEWRPLSQPLKIFDFDFTKPIPETQEIKISLFPTGEGIAYAIAFWFELKLNPKITLSTSPLEKTTHWQQAVYSITPPLALIPQKSYFLVATRNPSSIFFKLE